MPFHKIEWKQYKWLLFFFVIAISMIGVITIGSAQKELQRTQLIGLIAGLIIMFISSMVDYKFILKFYWIIYGIAVALLLAVFVLGYSSNNAQRWLTISSFRFQPSELCKILLILFFARFLSLHKEDLNTPKTLAKAALLIAIPVFFILKQPDLSTSIVVVLFFCSILFVAGLSRKLIILALSVGIPLFVIVFTLVIQPEQKIIPKYQQTRILAWLQPEDYSTSDSMQQQNSMMAIGSGQLTGKGLNNNKVASLKNGNFVPEPQTDFIFSVIGEELGFVGTVTVVLLLFTIVLQCILIGRRSQDSEGKLICVGMGSLIGFQSMINISVNTGLCPNTGVTLPFVSYGLTSLISLCIGIGIVLNVGLGPYRQEVIERRAKKQGKNQRQEISWSDVVRRTAMILVVLMPLGLLSGCGKEAEEEVSQSAIDQELITAVADYRDAFTVDSYTLSRGLCVNSEEVLMPEIDIIDSDIAVGLFDMNNMQTMEGYRLHERLYPASTTKLMVALLAMKYGNADDVVEVTSEALDIDPASSVAGLMVGDRQSLYDMLSGLMLVSGNDSANAIAQHIAGSVPAFVDMMNSEARTLGATNTHFVNAHGLHDPDHYTTAYDLYLIFQECLKQEMFREIIGRSVYEAGVTHADGSYETMLYEATNYYFKGIADAPSHVRVLGGKTGTTDEAGACLVLYSAGPDDRTYISIVLNSPTKPLLYEEMTDVLSQIPSM